MILLLFFTSKKKKIKVFLFDTPNDIFTQHGFTMGAFTTHTNGNYLEQLAFKARYFCFVCYVFQVMHRHAAVCHWTARFICELVRNKSLSFSSAAKYLCPSATRRWRRHWRQPSDLEARQLVERVPLADFTLVRVSDVRVLPWIVILL